MGRSGYPFDQLLSFPLTIGVAILLALLVTALQVPKAAFIADDLPMLSILEGVSPRTWIGPLDLYRFLDGRSEHMQVLRDSGGTPWFAAPELKLAFWRPLSIYTKRGL